MDSNRESEGLFSMRLSRVMGDIGVNSWMIARRRRRHLNMETLSDVGTLIRDIHSTAYIFGSQSEATTTPEMESDTDTLYCENKARVILDWRDWQNGKPNLLVLKNELTPPQHCYLQRLRVNCPLPAVQEEGPNDVLDEEGRILVANTWVEHQDYIQQLSKSGEIIRHGPSMTYSENIDHVIAYHCNQLPEECKFMFRRPRPGHWPLHDTLARAKEVGVFLVPQGFSENPTNQSRCKSTAFMVPSKLTSYPYSKWQWRFSTSLMERFLMFDLSSVQVKTYTLAKIIRKTLFKPVFGDRLSTFHIKTAMMFTIENYPPEIWQEDNFVKCLCLLFETLKRWLKQKYCPHFTISAVNLFVGKLHIWELPKLCNIISHLINTKLQCLFYTDMDNIGLRLLHCSDLKNVGLQNVSTRTHLCSVVQYKILFSEIGIFTSLMDVLIADNSVDGIACHLFNLQSMSDFKRDLELEVVTRYTQFLCSTLASLLASRCICLGQPIIKDIFNWYQLSLDSNLMSSTVKFASMLYCRGQHDEAAEVLNFCEAQLGPEMWQVCVHSGRKTMLPSTEFRHKLTTLSNTEEVNKFIMLCVTFTKGEIACIPGILAFEMIRSVENDNIPPHERWKDNVVTDCIPFMYYLQHLTYRGLHQPMRAQTALHNLHKYIYDTIETAHGHIETAFNMLGHCFELQNKLDLAWMCYSRSLEIYDRDNISFWHKVRILPQFLH